MRRYFSEDKFKFFLFFTVIAVALIIPAVKAKALTVSPVRLELKGDPGGVVEGELKLRNESDGYGIFYSTFENFEARGESGSPNFVAGTEGLATWIAAPEKIELSPNEFRDHIPFSIKIPKDAEPGGHFAAIFWTTNPPYQGSGLAIGAKVGTLILLRVLGEVEERGGIIEFGTIGKKKFFLHRPVNFFYRFRNDGADRIKPDGTVKIRNLLGIRSGILDGNPIEGNVLPDSVRRFELAWAGKGLLAEEANNWFENFWLNVRNEWRNFGLGRYGAKLSLDYGENKTLHSEAKYAFWVLPWHLLLIAAIVLLILYFVGRREVLAYNEWIVRRTLKHMKQLKEAARRYGGRKKV